MVSDNLKRKMKKIDSDLSSLLGEESNIKEHPSSISENVRQYDLEELKKARREFIFNSESRLKPATRDNIQGMNYILSEVDKYVFFLKNYLKLKEVDARTSPGLVLVGDSGLGKTLTARYIATVSKARFIEVNEFPREKPGWTPQDIQALFKFGRRYVEEKNKPIAFFWDELEVVAKEREKLTLAEASTVSTLTTQLDGFSGKSPGIILIATTNYVDSIDDALFRPGRLGHKILYTPPNRNGKTAILKYYVEKKNHEKDIDYHSVSFFFENGDSPAKIEETVEEAYLKSCFENVEELTKAKITTNNLISCLIENILGTPRETYLTEKQKKEAAIHEAGHAIVGRLLNLPVQIVTVMPHGYSEGRTISELEEGDNNINFQKNSIVQGFGGVIAERMLGINMGGNGKDLEFVTKTAFQLITDSGEGYKIKDCNLGALNTHNHPLRGPYFTYGSEKLKRNIEKDLFKMLKKSKKQATRLLQDYGRERINYVADKILEKNIVVQKDLDKIMKDARNLP